MRVTPELHIDFDLLRQQKAALVSIIDMSGEEDEAICDACEGILNLLDDIMDQAAKEYEEEAIFGVPNEG